MAQVLTSISGLPISAASAGFAPTNSADVSAIASGYQVVSSTATQLYAGTSYLTSVNGAPVSAARAGNAANASMANSAYYDGTGRLISALPDSAAVSAIASSYVESAVSSKQESSAMSAYALSSDVSGVMDTVSSNSASWGQGGVDSATVSSIASSYAESAASSKLESTAQVVTATAGDGTYVTSINGLGISGQGGGGGSVSVQTASARTLYSAAASSAVTGFSGIDGVGPVVLRSGTVVAGAMRMQLGGIGSLVPYPSSQDGDQNYRWSTGNILLLSGNQGYGYYKGHQLWLCRGSGSTSHRISFDVNNTTADVAVYNWGHSAILTPTGFSIWGPTTYDRRSIDSAVYDRWNSYSAKQDPLVFAYTTLGLISSINGSALGGAGGGGGGGGIDSTTCSAIASSYAESAVSGVVDTVSANSASWSQGGGDFVEKSATEVAIGIANTASSTAFVQGYDNIASSNSFAQGESNTAKQYSFAQGTTNSATSFSFAQGNRNKASGYSFAQGKNNTANYSSFAQGLSNWAQAESFAQGSGNSGLICSFAQGICNSARSTAAVFGTYNLRGDGNTATGNSAAFAIGDGTGSAARHDLMLVTKDGEITMYSSTADTAGTGIMSSIRAISAAATGGGVDSATVSSIASSYAESAASGKLDTTAQVVTATGSASAESGWWPPFTTSYLVSSINGSAILPYGYSSLSANSANWNFTRTTVTANSAKWNSAYSAVTDNSANWNSAYSLISGVTALMDAI